MKMKDLIGVQVYCRRNGTKGIIVAVDEDSGTLTIDVEGNLKVVTNSTYKRWYTIIPTDNPESVVSAVEQTGEEGIKTKQKKTSSKNKQAAGEAGIGVHLRDRFINIIKDMDLEGVEIFCNLDKKTDVVKYNGKNVFECSYASRRFNVLCHPDSLSPDNRRRVTKMCPKEWGWALRAKFVFTSLDEAPIMKSIISDGLYFRKDVKRS